MPSPGMVDTPQPGAKTRLLLLAPNSYLRCVILTALCSVHCGCDWAAVRNEHRAPDETFRLEKKKLKLFQSTQGPSAGSLELLQRTGRVIQIFVPKNPRAQINSLYSEQE